MSAIFSKAEQNRRILLEQSKAVLQTAKRLVSRHDVLVLLFLISLSFLYGVQAIVDHYDDSYFLDEGVYLYAASLMADGYVPYKDFLLVHPPGLEAVEAVGLALLGPNIPAFRILYLAFVLSGVLPLYGIAKKVSPKTEVALLAVFLFLTSTQLALRYFRGIMLETVMLPFLLSAVYFYLIGTAKSRFLAGLLIAIAVLVKLTAILFILPMVLTDLWNRRSLKETLWIVSGLSAVLIPALAFLLTIPNFLQNVVLFQGARYRVNLGFRIKEVMAYALNDPLVLLGGSLAISWLAFIKREEFRFLFLWITALPALLIFAFNSFFSGYLVPVIPGFALATALLFGEIGNRLKEHNTRTAFVSMGLLVAVLPNVVLTSIVPTEDGKGGSKYVRVGAAWDYTSVSPEVIGVLESGEGFLFTYDPIYGLYAGRKLYPWYYGPDLSAALNGAATAGEINEVIAKSDTVLLSQDPWFVSKFPEGSVS
ncbi:MAG: glycosyltransferase family 39 protein, partial [Candidatus Marsarchaeota archaeon]|nr:glycosyltransferase family 39 protein [Candidatus Marsarchaeota archaeon]